MALDIIMQIGKIKGEKNTHDVTGWLAAPQALASRRTATTNEKSPGIHRGFFVRAQCYQAAHRFSDAGDL